jgi:hypothetical protein
MAQPEKRSQETPNGLWVSYFPFPVFEISLFLTIIMEAINYQNILNFPFDSICRRFGQIGLTQPHRVTI